MKPKHQRFHNVLSDDLLDSVPQDWWRSALTTDETVVWTGRPHSRLDFASREIAVGVVGFAYTLFALIDMVIVLLRGGNWDRGQNVRPFAAHNVLIAGTVGLAFVSCGLVMLTAPLRAWFRAGNTAYVLTTRRALVCESSAWGDPSLREFAARDLRGMRCLAQEDGTGDLIMGARPIMGSLWWTNPVGFLAVAEVRAVEALVRTTLWNVSDAA